MQHENIHNLEDNLQSTIGNEFGCSQTPDDEMAHYHDGRNLMLFSILIFSCQPPNEKTKKSIETADDDDDDEIDRGLPFFLVK